MKFLKMVVRKLFIECTPLQGHVAHIPHGLFTVFAAVYVHWVVALLFGFGFIAYEVNQDWHLRDGAHYDLAGWLLGMVLGSFLFLIIELVF